MTNKEFQKLFSRQEQDLHQYMAATYGQDLLPSHNEVLKSIIRAIMKRVGLK